MEAVFFFSSRRRHTICSRDWSSDVCSSDLFSAANKPVLTVSPGDTVHTTTVDAGGTDEKGLTRVLGGNPERSEEHTSELQSRLHLVCRLLLEKKKKNKVQPTKHAYNALHTD